MTNTHETRPAWTPTRKSDIAPDAMNGADGDDVDRASRDSFPASDPPSWNGIHVGSPRAEREPRGRENVDGSTSSVPSDRSAERR